MSINTLPSESYDAPPSLDDPANARLETRFEVPKLQGFGDTLDRTLGLYRANFKLIAIVSLILLIPLDVVAAFCEVFHDGEPVILLAGNAASLIQSVAQCLAAPAIIFAMIIRLRDHRAVGTNEAISWGAKAWLRTLGYQILVGLIVWLGLLLLIVPGIIFLTWYVLVDVVVAAEGRRHPGVMARSKELTEGKRWWIVGFYAIALLGALLIAILYGVIVEVVLSMTNDVWSLPGLFIFGLDVALAAAFSLLAWLFTAFAVVLYMDGVGTHIFDCPACGYNLTGNVSGACAECGQVIPEHVRDLIAVRESELV